MVLSIAVWVIAGGIQLTFICGCEVFSDSSKSSYNFLRHMGSTFLFILLCPTVLVIVLTSHVYTVKSKLPLSSLRLGGLELSILLASSPSGACVSQQAYFSTFFSLLILKDRTI